MLNMFDILGIDREACEVDEGIPRISGKASGAVA
jgi:hypothetical protein